MPSSNEPLRRFPQTSLKAPNGGGVNQFVLHLEVALGSQAELEVQLELAARLGFVDETDYSAIQEQADHVGRMLNRLIDHLRNYARLTTND